MIDPSKPMTAEEAEIFRDLDMRRLGDIDHIQEEPPEDRAAADGTEQGIDTP